MGSKLVVGVNDLASVNPKLVSEWDYEKNENLKPTDVLLGASRKVWWKCSKGHEWQESPNNRNHGYGCPYCSGRRVLAGVNDLQTWCIQNGHKNILDEWDYVKNELKPTEISYASNKKFYWICSKGHKWEADAAKRTGGSGCPYCSGHRILAGFNDFRTWCITNGREELLSEWNELRNGDLTPEMVMPKTKSKVWWICKYGHEWQAAVGNRATQSNCNCPYCLNHKILTGYNDLQTKTPSLALEWNYEKNGDLKPTEIGVNNSKLVWWKCRYGHEWKASAHSRYRSGCGCPKCSNCGTSLPEQGIAYYLEKVCKVEQRVKIADKELDVYLPEYNIGIEYDGKRWHTEKSVGKEEEKDLQVTKAGVVIIRVKEADANYVDDNRVYYKVDNLGKNYNWVICELGKSLAGITGNSAFSLIDVDAQRDMLSIYARLDRYFEERSLTKLYPSIARDWHLIKNGTLTPDMFSAGSIVKVWWQCSKGHEWQAIISSRTRGGGCPTCSGKRCLAGFNDLATTYPDLLKDWDFQKNVSVVPSEVTFGSSKKVWWKCHKCGLEWETKICNRTGHGTGCPKCSFEESIRLRDKKHASKVGILAEKFPEIANLWHPEKNGDLTPFDVSCGSNKLVWWMCPLGHAYRKRIRNMVKFNDGCPCCK